jgi:hypothetical protein
MQTDGGTVYWLTTIALVLAQMRGEGGWVVLWGRIANEYSCSHGAQKNFGDLTPLTYVAEALLQ